MKIKCSYGIEYSCLEIQKNTKRWVSVITLYTPMHASLNNLLGDTPARFVKQLTREHPCTVCELTIFIFGISDGVENGRNIQAAGRAGL